jgi:hypothetical protein
MDKPPLIEQTRNPCELDTLSNSIVDKMSYFANGWLQNLQDFAFSKFQLID